MPISHMSEADAIEGAKKGDVAGYEALYDLYKGNVYALCLRWTGNQSDAEDFTQEVFLQVYRKIHTFRGDAKLGTWLYRVTVNLIMLDRRRKKKERASTVTLAEDFRIRPLRSMPAGLTYPLERVALSRAMEDLTPTRRNVVVLHDIRGWTHKEASRVLGLTIKTVKSNLFKTHKSLRNILWRVPSRTKVQIANK